MILNRINLMLDVLIYENYYSQIEIVKKLEVIEINISGASLSKLKRNPEQVSPRMRKKIYDGLIILLKKRSLLKL